MLPFKNNIYSALFSDVNDSSDEDDLFGTKLSDSQKTKEPEVLARDDTWRKEAPVREWDKDKKPEPPVKGELLI